jgi:uncharacterized protein YcbK (DUF882 family)
MGDFTRNFSRSEFACKCGCGLDSIDPALVNMLQDSRDATALTYVIASGCRCERHNREIGGKPNSAHIRGKAADIICVGSQMRYKIVKDLITRFRRVEVCNEWIHVDIDSTLPQDVLFLE